MFMVLKDDVAACYTYNNYEETHILSDKFTCFETSPSETSRGEAREPPLSNFAWAALELIT
jgi:hypothetical protein